jgi:hypothetical protein
MVKKKDWGWRMCIDFRKLNACSEKSHQLLPTIPDVANILAQKRYFTKLDMSSGYWQIPLEQSSKELTTFITPGFGVYTCKWERLPFGLTSAPATFVRLMEAVLRDFIVNQEVICYVDDILVASKTFEEHLDLLRRVFNRLRDQGLKLKLSKADFCGKQLEYLGHIINEHGYTPSPENTKRLKEYPSPKTVRETQRLLGYWDTTDDM